VLNYGQAAVTYSVYTVTAKSIAKRSSQVV